MFTPGFLKSPSGSGDLVSNLLAVQLNQAPEYFDVFNYPQGTIVTLTDTPSSIAPTEGNTCVFSPDGSLLVRNSTSGVIEVWDTSDWTKSSLSPGIGTIRFIEFSPDGTEFCLSGSSSPYIKRYTSSTLTAFSDPSTLPTSGGTLFSTAYTPDGTKILMAYSRPGLAIDQVAYTLPDMTLISSGIPNLGNGLGVVARVMKFNTLRYQLAVGYNSGGIKVFNSDWSEETISDQPSGDCYSLDWNKSGSKLIVADNGGSQKVKIYNTVDWDGSATLGTSSNHSTVYDIRITDDGRFFGISGTRVDTSTQGVMIYNTSNLALFKQIGGNFDSRSFDFN